MPPHAKIDEASRQLYCNGKIIKLPYENDKIYAVSCNGKITTLDKGSKIYPDGVGRFIENTLYSSWNGETIYECSEKINTQVNIRKIPQGTFFRTEDSNHSYLRIEDGNARFNGFNITYIYGVSCSGKMILMDRNAMVYVSTIGTFLNQASPPSLYPRSRLYGEHWSF